MSDLNEIAERSNNINTSPEIIQNQAFNDIIDYNNKNSNPLEPHFVLPDRSITNLDNNNTLDIEQGVHFRKQKKPPAFARHVSFQPSVGGQSQISSHSEIDLHIPPPSTQYEKSKTTRKFFAIVTTLSYSLFLIIFGAIAFIGDAVQSQYPLVPCYCIVLIVLGSAYFIFLYIDIRVHVHKAKKTLKKREKRQALFEEQLVSYQNNGFVIDENGIPSSTPLPNGPPNGTPVHLPEWNVPVVKPLSHRYCFATGRHGEFFYLKVGATWFCFGLLIHSILVINYQVIFLLSTDPDFVKCTSIITLVLDIMFPVYSIFIMFFIFKYANVIINENRGLARLALMHIMGSSLTFWIYTIVRETSDAIRLKDYDKEKKENGFEEIDDQIIRSYWASGSEFIKEECMDYGTFHTIYRTFSPYLYPFIIEFYILIVGIFYMIYSNINKCPKRLSAPGHDHSHDIYDIAETVPGSGIIHDHNHTTEHPVNGNHHPSSHSPSSDSSSNHCGTTVDHENQYRSNFIIHADCHSSNRGLFAGLILLVVTIAFIILFFVAVSNDKYVETGILTNSIFEIIVLVILIISVILAYMQTTKLDVNHHPISLLDDVLLFIAIPAFFSETIFSMVPAIENGSGFNIARIVCQLIQVLIQTPFIIDGLRRCANAKELRKKKPGRELVTFLTIANVSLWAFYAFSVKTGYTGDERYEHYGDALWTILNHLSLPLIMFYRFHASVCLVDIWRHAYEPGGH